MADFVGYVDADTLPAEPFALPAAFFWLADVIHNNTGEATKIEL